MIKPGLFIIRPGSVQCTDCMCQIERTNDLTHERWGDVIQSFMDAHKNTCGLEPEESGE